MIIIVFLLELEKIFLYTCSQNNKSDSQNMLEAEIYYDYLKKYKPISILKKIDTDNQLDIDKYVKQYMIEYGIENVRGGTYSDETLSVNLMNTLLYELKTGSTIINKNHEEIIDSFIKKYAYKQLTSEEIYLERQSLETVFEKFKKDKDEYDSIKINGSQIIEDIQWIQFACSQIMEIYNKNRQYTYLSTLISKEFIEKYRKVLVSLKTIYTICKKQNYSSSIDNIYVKYPYFLLDDFFYHLHRVHIKKYMDEVEQLCKTYEYMTNIIINKMDEKAFDISSWGEDIEWKIPRALYLLDKIKKYVKYI